MEEEAIDLRDLWFVLTKKYKLIAAITVVAIMAAGLVSYFVLAPVYEASTTLMVLKNNQGVEDYAAMQLNRGLVKTYGEIAKSRRVLTKVADNLALDVSANGLASSLQINPVGDTELMEIRATASSPQQAQQIAAEVATVFMEQIQTMLNLENLSIVDQALANPNPIQPRPKLNMAIAAVLGVMLGTFLSFFLEFLDTTFKTEEDVDRILGLPVMGVIPIIDPDKAGRTYYSKGRAY